MGIVKPAIEDVNVGNFLAFCPTLLKTKSKSPPFLYKEHMPLNKSKSKKAFEQNVKTEVKAGKPVKQAVAIAYATKGEKPKAKKK